jgi:hypothetical protein
MLQNLASQFLGGSQNIDDATAHNHVTQMMQTAPQEHVQGAVTGALSKMGPEGFSGSVRQAAEKGGPAQSTGIADMLLNAVTRSGGSTQQALAASGSNGQSFSPEQLGKLAGYVHQNHSDGLAGLLTNQVGGANQGGGGGAGMLSLLGSPMVRQIGEQLAQRVTH